MCEHAWQKGKDCGWNQRTARLVLLPLLFCVLALCLFVLSKLRVHNKSWTSRPVLCLLCVSVSQAADIVENIFVLSELREHGYNWYSNSAIDALGDIFLMTSLYLFAQIWCDNVEILAARCEGASPRALRDLRIVRLIYKALAVLTVPWALLFAVGSTTHKYDEFMILYIAWGVLTGFSMLTPAAFMMRNVIENLPEAAREKSAWRQLRLMARVNLYEQFVWNALITITIMSIVLYFHGGETSSAYIGIASVAISVCWILIHLQVVLFFLTVTKAGASSPVFDHAMLESLMDMDQGGAGFLEGDSHHIELNGEHRDVHHDNEDEDGDRGRDGHGDARVDQV